VGGKNFQRRIHAVGGGDRAAIFFQSAAEELAARQIIIHDHHAGGAIQAVYRRFWYHRKEFVPNCYRHGATWLEGIPLVLTIWVIFGEENTGGRSKNKFFAFKHSRKFPM
jgi:hypothetical protein